MPNNLNLQAEMREIIVKAHKADEGQKQNTLKNLKNIFLNYTSDKLIQQK
jgi:hypothetical protein